MMRILSLVVAIVLGGFVAPAAIAADAWEPAVRQGVEFLKTQIPRMNSSDAGIAAFTMHKARVPMNDLGLVACLAKLGANFNGTTYTPEAKGGGEIYEASVAIMAMASLDRKGYRPYIEAACDYILSKQMPNGAWDFFNRTSGDVSITQYALLGVWEGESSGVKVSPKVWDSAAKWLIAMQGPQGSWNAQRDDSTSPESVTMTGAAVSSLMICQRQLARYRKGPEEFNPLMTPIITDGSDNGSFKAETTSEAVNKAIQSGIKWMTDHFQTSNASIVGQSLFECLYVIERVIALAESTHTSVPSDWYKRGVAYVLGNQRTSGAWDAGQQKEVPNTCWAILFMVKATADTIHREEVRRLRAGHDRSTLPTNPDELVIVQGGLAIKPMSGTVEGMLDAMEDPEGKKAEAALLGLIDAYQKDGPKVLRTHKERFRKHINGRDAGLRKVAIWALGRTGDLDVAPVLIKSLLDPDDDVVKEARISLQMLSRKLDGLGPEPKASPEERQAAALKWQQWFESVRPPDLDIPSDLPTGSTVAK